MDRRKLNSLSHIYQYLVTYLTTARWKKYILFGSILDHKIDGHALSVVDQDVVVHGKSLKRKTMRGCHLCVQCKDRKTTWERLSHLKEYHRIQVAEYSFAHGISHEPAFNWCVTHVLNKKESIISALKFTSSRVVKKNIKLFIWVPQTANEAMRLDKKNGNHLWRDGMSKEINAFIISFKLLD